jgi:hypothetical protein
MGHEASDPSDFWKGLSLVGLTINHLILWPCENLNFLLRITYQGMGWVSFASVFFAIAGIHWGRRIESQCELSKFLHWNARRALKLFSWVVFSSMLFSLCVQWRILTPAPWQSHIPWHTPENIALALLGLRLPWLIDVIWLHGWLGIFSTLLWSVPALRRSGLCLLSTSGGIWLVSQAGLLNIENFIDGPLIKELAPSWHSWGGWQFLFIASAVSQRTDMQKYLQILQKKKSTVLILASTLIFFFLKHMAPIDENESRRMTAEFSPLFAINSMLIGLLFSKIKVSEVLLMARIPCRLRPVKILKTIGRHSLLFYSLQCIFIYLSGRVFSLSQNQRVESFLVLLFWIILLSAICLIRHRTSKTGP